MFSEDILENIPGLLIVIVIFAFNKLGNVLRVFADPQVMSGERG